MPLLIMPDMVKILVAFYRAQTEVTALLGDPLSVRGSLAPGTVFPAVKVVRITSEPIVARPHVVEAVRMQMDCYGGNNRQAERLAQTVRSSLLERGPNYSNDEGVITKVRPVQMADTPDDSQDPPRERYIVEMDVWVRPLLLV